MTLVLAGCLGRTPQIEYVVPVVPEDLRTPVSVPDRSANTLTDVGLILTDHVEALHTANGRIEGIDCILDAAERGQDPRCD